MVYDPERGCVRNRRRGDGPSDNPYVRQRTKLYEGSKVAQFAAVMREKLNLRRGKGGWNHYTPQQLFDLLEAEVVELKAAVRSYVGAAAFPDAARREARALAFEAADVANYAMMLADVCGGLDSVGQDELVSLQVERDRWAARVQLLEGRLDRARAIAAGEEDP